MSLKNKIYAISYVDKNTDTPLSWFNKLVIALTILAISLSILTTEQMIRDQYGKLIIYTEFILGLIFSTEIIMRLWSVGINPSYAGIKGRLKYVFLPATIFDILATIPLLLVTSSTNTSMLRVLRLIRLVRFVNLGRYSTTLSYFGSALKSHWPELVFSFIVSLFFLLISATSLFLIEGSVQPEAFGSIPRALWWAVATLTTVGYGDVYPITGAGRFAASVIAIIGIGAVAMPAGIFAAAFNEAFQARKNSKNGEV